MNNGVRPHRTYLFVGYNINKGKNNKSKKDNIMRYILLSCLLGIVLSLTSCLPEFSCDEWADSFKDDKTFHLILDRKENNTGRDAYFYGIDLSTKNATEFYDGSGWIASNFDKFNIGDTLIKNKGKYTIIIKRKGEIILIPFECSDKIYKDK